MKKTKVAIIGTGKIGCDLLTKVIHSDNLECILFAGKRENSEGISYAKKLGIPTSSDSLNAVIESHSPIVFDCTNAMFHTTLMKHMNDRFVIDLTPSHSGYMCIPSINLEKALIYPEVSLISCGAQTIIPKIYKIKDLEYVEAVTTIASRSAGVGTRDNISEYLTITAEAIEEFCQVKAKSILIINPANPPIHMFNTVYLKKKDTVDILQFEVTGQGDYLPSYAGNLDAITSAALQVATGYAYYNH